MMEREFWEQQYPQMPENFHLAVKSAVKKALSGSEREDVSPENHGTTQLMEYQRTAAAVCEIMTENQRTAAEEQQDVPFTKQNVKADPQTDYSSLMETDILVKAEDTPIYSDSVSQEDIGSYEKLETDEPLLSIESVYYDGLTLAFVAAPTEEAQKYVSFESFGTRINGEAGAAGLMYVEGKFDLEAENADKDTAVSGYYFSGATYDRNLESPFTVTVPLRVYGENGRCENQDLTFTVNLPSQAETLPDQEFTQDGFTVTLTGLEKSPASLYGTITIKMTETQYTAWQQSHNTENTSAVILPLFTDPEGNTCTMRSLKEITETSETTEIAGTSGTIETTEIAGTIEATEIKEIIESKAITEIQEIEGAPGTTDITDASTASVLTDFTHTNDVYTASAPFLITLPDQAATELTLTLTTRNPAEADTLNPTVTLLGAPMHFSLES